MNARCIVPGAGDSGTSRHTPLPRREARILTQANFFAVNGHILRRADAEADLSAFDVEHGYRDVIAQCDRLAWAPCEYQNVRCSFILIAWNDGLRDMEHISLSHGASKIHACLAPVSFFQLNAYEPPLGLERHESFTANSHERR